MRQTHTARDGQELRVDPRTGYITNSTSRLQTHVGRNISRAHGTRTRRELFRLDGSLAGREDHETLTLDADGPVSLARPGDEVGRFMGFVWFMVCVAALLGGTMFAWNVGGGWTSWWSFILVAGWWVYAYRCVANASQS